MHISWQDFKYEHNQCQPRNGTCVFSNMTVTYDSSGCMALEVSGHWVLDLELPCAQYYASSLVFGF